LYASSITSAKSDVTNNLKFVIELLAKKLVKDALKDYKYDFSRSDQENQVEMLKIVSLHTKKKNKVGN
jgi:hypothetical protein